MSNNKVLLEKRIQYYDEMYYNHGISVVSDDIYDSLRLMINSDHIGANAIQHSVAHRSPMLSLDNAFDKEQVTNFINKTGASEFWCELKIDGLSLSLIYHNYTLTEAVTRGNGHVGESVLENAFMIKCIPQTISISNIEIRGEVYMKLSIFKALQETYNFSNPRNAAVGSLRQQNPMSTKDRNLDFIAYEINSNSFSMEPVDQSEKVALLDKLGFSIVPMRRLCSTIEEIDTFFQEVKEYRESLDLLIDGVVIKVNSHKIQDHLGHTSRSPRYAIAWKFPMKESATSVVNISVQVGKNGNIIPVAELEPVYIDGVKITHATLHNFDFIKNNNINIGDIVSIRRAGEVIPQILNLIHKNSNSFFEQPQSCPSCSSLIVSNVCTKGWSCKEQAIARLEHFTNCFDIKGLGTAIIRKLFDLSIIRYPSDIFYIDWSRMKTMDGYGEVSCKNLAVAIEAAKNVSLANFINAFSIPSVGISKAQKIASLYPSYDAAISVLLSSEKLILIDGIGAKTSYDISSFVHENLGIIQKVAEIVCFIQETKTLSGLSIAFTGTLQTVSRNEAKRLAIQNGAIVSENVNTKTSIVVCGASPTASKIAKASKYRIDIISEQEWLSMLKTS